MRVFVAGGTGVVGRSMIPRLIEAGHTVVAITRKADRLPQLHSAGAEGALCDVLDPAATQSAVRSAGADAIVHQLTDLPASMDPRRLEEAYARNNRVRREGTRTLLDAARAAGISRVIVQSMATWYRPEGEMVKTEMAPLWVDAPEPIGEAVRTLAAMEAAVLADVPVGIVLRYGGLYGPGTWYARDGDVALRMRHHQFPMVGDGSAVLSFIHVDDAAAAAVAALEHPVSETFNIADSDPAPAHEWMPAYASAIGAPAPWKVPAMLVRLLVGKALVEWMTTMRGASNRKALEQLRWSPTYSSWREGFAHT